MDYHELVQGELPQYLELLKELDKESTLSLEEAMMMLDKVKTYPYYKVFMVYIAGELVGTFSLIICDNFGHGGRKFSILENVVVHPSQHRLGIGRAMMEEAILLSQENGCYKLMLSSNEKRKDAHAFYDSLGFKRHGVSFIMELIK